MEKQKYPLIEKFIDKDVSWANGYNSLETDIELAKEVIALFAEDDELEKRGERRDLPRHKELCGLWDKIIMTNAFHYMSNNIYANTGKNWRHVI